MVEDGRNLMASWCTGIDAINSCPFDSQYYMKTIVEGERGGLMNLLQSGDSQAFRQGIIAAYQRIPGEANRYDPETVIILKRTYGPKYGDALLRNDLLRGTVKSIYDRPDYEQLMGSMLSGDPSSVIQRLLQPSIQADESYLFPDEFFSSWMQSPYFMSSLTVEANDPRQLPPLFFGQGGLGNIFGSDMDNKSSLFQSPLTQSDISKIFW
jgi:hypothetical protein